MEKRLFVSLRCFRLSAGEPFLISFPVSAVKCRRKVQYNRYKYDKVLEGFLLKGKMEDLLNHRPSSIESTNHFECGHIIFLNQPQSDENLSIQPSWWPFGQSLICQKFPFSFNGSTSCRKFKIHMIENPYESLSLSILICHRRCLLDTVNFHLESNYFRLDRAADV